MDMQPYGRRGKAPDPAAASASRASTLRGRPFKAAIPLCCALGYGLNSVWCILIGHTPSFMEAITISGISANPRLFYLAGMLTFALACIVWPGRIRQMEGALRIAMPIAGLAGAACFAFPANGLIAPFVPWGPIGLFVTGIVFLWIAARYILLLVRTRTIRSVIACVAGGIVAKVALVQLVNISSSFAVHMACAALALIGSSLLFETSCLLMRREHAADGQSTASSGRTIFGIPQTAGASPRSERSEGTSMVVLLVSAAIALAVVRCVSYLGLWGNASAAISESSPWLLGVVVPSLLVAAFAHFALGRLQALPIATRFQPALFITLAGLFAAAIKTNPSGEELALLGSVIQICELFAHLLLWVVTATALKELALPSYRTVGLGWGVYSATSIAWVALLAQAPITVTLIAMFFLYLLLITLLYIVGRLSTRQNSSRENRIESAEGDPVARQPTLLERCEGIARDCRLSPRETEVFMLLVQGRSHSFIQEELGLSLSTVKTHVTHIYTKMNVDGRQGLLDMIWTQNRPPAAPAKGDA